MNFRILSLVTLVAGACNSVDLSTIMAGDSTECDDPDVVYVTVDPDENAASDTDVADSGAVVPGDTDVPLVSTAPKGVLEGWMGANGFIQADPGQNEVPMTQFIYELTLFDGAVGSVFVGPSRFVFTLDVDSDGHFDTPFDRASSVMPQDVLSTCRLHSALGDLNVTAPVIGEEVDYGQWLAMMRIDSVPLAPSKVTLSCNFKLSAPHGVKIAVRLREQQVDSLAIGLIEDATVTQQENLGSQPTYYVEIPADPVCQPFQIPAPGGFTETDSYPTMDLNTTFAQYPAGTTDPQIGGTFYTADGCGLGYAVTDMLVEIDVGMDDPRLFLNTVAMLSVNMSNPWSMATCTVGHSPYGAVIGGVVTCDFSGMWHVVRPSDHGASFTIDFGNFPHQLGTPGKVYDVTIYYGWTDLATGHGTSSWGFWAPNSGVQKLAWY